MSGAVFLLGVKNMISRLNACAPSFGVVKRSAIELAIKNSGGSSAATEFIKNEVNYELFKRKTS